MARTKGATKIKPIPVPAAGSTGARSGSGKGAVRTATFAGQKFSVSPVLDMFFYFMAERHRIHQLRLAGEDPPWSKDDLMNSYPFTNVFRVYDRTTQYILRNVIKKGSQDLNEVCFRVILFRFFNKPETWEFLEEHLGTPTLKWSEYDASSYDRVLLLLECKKIAPYSGCYISPAPPFGWKRNYSNHLRLVQVMMEDNLPSELKALDYLKDAHGRVCLYPAIGDFVGQQLLLDLNMTGHFLWSEKEWTALGPGSSACLRKMFGPQVAHYEQEALHYLFETQETHFLRLGISGNQVPRLSNSLPAGVSCVDIEHQLCECEKYCRGKFPDIKGKRTVVGRPYRESPLPISADLPEHWLRPQPKVPSPSRPSAVVTEDGDPYYEVSHIVAEKKGVTGETRARYLVRWVGWGPEDDWWLSEKDLGNASEVLKKWNATKERIAARIAQVVG
ncbi:hypothetical protein EIP91_012212 [Steccherinum ochraceum]|uniref:Chromo domain-containing protein n=1 Tax=Steccherinum ochraceum TaxID=92696 RepID=A0A4R0RKC1_9APHY|nr:hypothetical protein EIP91_012212 [Steccherinum ochraceum]